MGNFLGKTIDTVSTHSRPKAAGVAPAMASFMLPFQLTAARRRLVLGCLCLPFMPMFQLTAARRRLVYRCSVAGTSGAVSTHSRPKAAGCKRIKTIAAKLFQLTAARRRLAIKIAEKRAVNGFQLTAARRRLAAGKAQKKEIKMFQLTAARRRLGTAFTNCSYTNWFQLTAARRRLANMTPEEIIKRGCTR